MTPIELDLSPESPSTPTTVRLRKKAYSDLSTSPIPRLSLSADEESPTKPPASSPANLTVETGDKQPVQGTHSPPGSKDKKGSRRSSKLELSCKWSWKNVCFFFFPIWNLSKADLFSWLRLLATVVMESKVRVSQVIRGP